MRERVREHTNEESALSISSTLSLLFRWTHEVTGLSQRKIELKWRGDTEARLVDAEGGADEIAKLVLARMEAGD